MSHYVYRAYDTTGALLYVGVTGNMQARMQGHRSRSTWYSLACRVEHDGPMPMDEAYRVEQALIDQHQPAHNKQSGSQPPSRSPIGQVNVNLRVYPEGLALVDKMAQEEQRTRSDMIRILISEAVKARVKR